MQQSSNKIKTKKEIYILNDKKKIKNGLEVVYIRTKKNIFNKKTRKENI